MINDSQIPPKTGNINALTMAVILSVSSDGAWPGQIRICRVLCGRCRCGRRAPAAGQLSTGFLILTVCPSAYSSHDGLQSWVLAVR